MIKKLGLAAALTTLALAVSACVIIDVQKPHDEDKPAHHVSAGPTT